MIVEHAELTVDPDRIAEFEEAFAEARAYAAGARGFQDLQLWHSVETPGRYRLLIRWGSVADHMEGFRDSPDFERWRALLSPFYAASPQVDHLELVSEQSPR